MTRTHKISKAVLIGFACLSLVIMAMPSPADAQRRNSFGDSKEHRPYDNKLMRLAEILGATHYLRELCRAQEGQRWRQQMDALIDAEGTSAKRRSRHGAQIQSRLSRLSTHLPYLHPPSDIGDHPFFKRRCDPFSGHHPLKQINSDPHISRPITIANP